jgi:hypothetical protein
MVFATVNESAYFNLNAHSNVPEIRAQLDIAKVMLHTGALKPVT